MSSKGAQRSIDTVISNLSSRLEPVEASPRLALDGEANLHLLLYSFLLWESTPKRAASAMRRLLDAVIDVNELRVAMPQEIASILNGGREDPLASERAARLRASLNDLYAREHSVSLSRLETLSKREAREFLDSLEGIPAFVAARVTLHGLGGHAVPVDDMLRSRLVSVGALDESLDIDESSRWLERQIRATDAPLTCLLFDAWRDAPIKTGAPPKPSGTKSAKKSAARKAASSTRTKASSRKKSSTARTSKRTKKGS